MEPSPRDGLRHAVRRVVHQACWRRLEGDHPNGDAGPDADIVQARQEHTGINVTDDEIRHWIAEDEAEFDRAILISDLVARRVQRSVATAPAAVLSVEPAEAKPAGRRHEEPARRPVRTPPSISTLLDDMLAQQRPVAAPRAAP